MAVGEGKFVLYSRIEPPLEAGEYRLTARQELAGSGPKGALGSSALPVAELPTHFRVRAPRYALPPDQVLSVFPPANTEGNYGDRLPQVVIKRRTLPWERLLRADRRGIPWLALVVIAEGEAELKMNQPVADCVTPGAALEGVADATVGHYLQVRRSVVDRVFPTRLDVPLLAHAREVDIHDTELMMGDDDGFLAVVIANRLPLPARDADGNEVPVKYLACLINLEGTFADGTGQFDVLIPTAPPAQLFTDFPVYQATMQVNVAALDHLAMGSTPPGLAVSGALGGAVGGPVVGPVGPIGDDATPRGAVDDSADGAARGTRAVAANATPVAGVQSGAAAFNAPSQYQAAAKATASDADVYTQMAQPFAKLGLGLSAQLLEPVYRFPVLLHWSFTSVGDTSFKSLLQGVDSGLLGTVDGRASDEPPAGRPPLEVVETGHVGLAHRTRRGDSGRTWYRGPCVPHPTADPPGGRLPLAHAADQLRIVIPDGREDLSLASAFEIGRLLALARPSMVAALLRWRQVAYQTARRRAVWEHELGSLTSLIPDLVASQVDAGLGVHLGRALVQAVAARPADFLGNPNPLASPGRPLALDVPADRALAAGFALSEQVLRGTPAEVLGKLRQAPVVTAPAGAVLAGALGGQLAGAPARRTRDVLTAQLDAQLGRLALDALAPQLAPVVTPGGPGGIAAGPRGRGRAGPAPDALDQLIAALDAAADATPNDESDRAEEPA